MLPEAPTGSGKTVLFELSIIRMLKESARSGNSLKCVYMAPTKALCSERHKDWTAKFSSLGVKCACFASNLDFRVLWDWPYSRLRTDWWYCTLWERSLGRRKGRLDNVRTSYHPNNESWHVLNRITTGEKWDSLTRNWYQLHLVNP